MKAGLRTAAGPLGWIVAVAVAALGVAVEVGWLLQGAEEWRQAQLSAVVVHAGAVNLLAPLAAAVAAAEVGLLRASAVGVMAQAQRRTARVVLRAGLRAGGLLALLHLMGAVTALVVARSYGLVGPPPVAAALPALLALPAFGLVGAAVAWRVRSIAVPPALAAGLFVLLLNTSDKLRSQVLNLGANGDYVGSEVRDSWVLAAALTVGLLGLSALATAAPRGRPVALVAGLGVLAFLLAGPGLTTREQRVALTCDGAQPAVCAYPERAAFLPETRTVLVSLQQRLEELGVPPSRWPARYAEDAQGSAVGITVDPEDHPGLVGTVMAAATRCEPEDALDGGAPYLELWLSRRAYGDAEAAETSPVDGPPGVTAQPRVEREARAYARRLAAQSCG